MKWIRKLIYKIFIVEMLVVGCSNSTPIPTPTLTPSPEQIDKSLFTGTPCAAPCWHGLEVGKSTEKDAIAVLPSLTFIDQKSVQITQHLSMPDYYVMESGPGVAIIANCANSDRICLLLFTANDILQKIIVGLNYEIRPDEAIEYLGNPDYVGYAIIGSEKVLCEVDLVWRNSRLILATKFDSSVGPEKYCDVVRDEGKVPASMQILEAQFLSDPELDSLLSTGFSTFFEFSGTIPDK